MPTLNLRDSVDVTIDASASTSSTADLGGSELIAMIMPAAMTGGTLTFLGSVDNVTFYEIWTDYSTQPAVTFVPGKQIELSKPIISTRYLKVKSNAPEAASRALKLITRPA